MWKYEKPKQKEIPPSSLIAQRVRKRVKGREDSFSNDDIYYDKSDNKYYNNMLQEAPNQNVTVDAAEWDMCRTLSEKEGRAAKTIILAKAEQAEEAEPDKKVKFIRYESKSGIECGDGKLQFTATPFAGGSELSTQPKTIRLYAEGNMDHAHSLAQSLTSRANYSKFYHLNDSNPDAAGDSFDVLIKATEYESQENVVKRYANTTQELQIDKIPNITQEQKEQFQSDESFIKKAKLFYNKGRKNQDITENSKNAQYRVFYEAGRTEYNASIQPIREKIDAAYADERLEASFGSTTGDLSRAVNETGSKRQYDIIQTTFFWLPQETNQKNLEVLKTFCLNQRFKLKQGGKIRITLAGVDRRPGAPLREHNDYLFVAENLCRDSELSSYYNISKTELKRGEQNQKYSDRLDALGLNPAGFKHTQTKQNKEVSSPGDLVIEATLKPASEVLRVSETSDTH